MRIRRIGILVVSVWLGSCSWVAPSLPFSPTAVAAPDSSTYIATVGCERRVLSVTLGVRDTDYWLIESQDPAGTLLSTVTVGVTPDGFDEVTPLDPAWIDGEVLGRRGASLAFIAPEDEPGLPVMGMSMPAAAGYGWLFGDIREGPGETWEAYRTFVTDERQVGGNACDQVIPEPGG
jgi:hypothetical protein